jgi:predicted nucleic acid-binding protein
MKYLFDTCVISELVSKKPSARVIDWVDSLDPDNVYLSVITIGEIIKGIEKLPKSHRKTELHTWLKEDLLSRFQGKVIPVDTDVIVEWGILTAHVESAGKSMPAIDALLAATANVKQLTLVTRNVGDFAAADVKVLNPWD